MLYHLNLVNVYSFNSVHTQSMTKRNSPVVFVRCYSFNHKLPADFLDLFSSEFLNDPAFNVIISELGKYNSLVSQFSVVVNNEFLDIHDSIDADNFSKSNEDLINRINMLKNNIKHILKEHGFSKNEIDKIFICYPFVANNDLNLNLFDVFNDNYKKYIKILNKFDVIPTPRFLSDLKQIFYILYLVNNCKESFAESDLFFYNNVPSNILDTLNNCLKDKALVPGLDNKPGKVLTKQQQFANIFLRKDLSNILLELYKKFSSGILNSSNSLISEINAQKLKIRVKELLLRDLEARAEEKVRLAQEQAELKALQDQMNRLRLNLSLVFSSQNLMLSFDQITGKSKFKKVLSYVNSKAKDLNKLLNYDLESIPNIITSLESMKPVQRSQTFSFDSPFYVQLDKIINGSEFQDLSLSDKQRLIEDACVKYEENLFEINMEYLKEKGLNVQTSVLHDLNIKLVKFINATLQPWIINSFEKLIKEKDITKVKIILLIIFLTPEFLVNILFSNIIYLLTEKDDVKKNRFCMEIADKIIKKYKTRNIIKDIKFNFPKDLNLIIKNNSNLNSIFKDDTLSFTEEDKGELGGFIVDILIHNFDLLIQSEIWDDNKTHYALRVNPVYISKVYLAVMNTYKLPMISTPLNWGPNHIGGYLSSSLRSILNSPISNNSKMKEHSNLSKLQYDTINFLNHQKFVINKEMLDYLSNEWLNDNSLIFRYTDEDTGLPLYYNKIHPDSNKISELKNDNNLFKKVQAHNAIYFSNYNILSLSTIYGKLDSAFYLPTFFDFRGRIYPIVNYLSYQTGGDLVRSLIQFHGSCSLSNNSLGHVKHYFANVYGNNGLDKLSNDEKNNWFDKNFVKIARSYIKDREDFNQTYLINAKEPFQFISVLITLISYFVNKGKGIDIFPNIAILFDATCSGSQHLSALCSDLTLAKMVNVLPNGSPSDIYALAGEHVAKEIENIEDIGIRNSLSRINIHRNLMKKAVMTTQYNISLSGLSDDLQKNFFKPIFTRVPGELNEKGKPKIDVHFVLSDPKYIKDPNIKTLTLTGTEFGNLATIIHKSLYQMIPTLQELINYFNKMLGIINKINAPVTWVSPSGMKINLSPLKFEKRKTKAKFLEKSKPITISVPTKELSKKDLKLSFIANFVHSLDSANIHILIKLLLEHKNNLNNESKHINLYTIHDCFASSANQIDLIDKLLKEAFIDMYFNENYLENLHNNLIWQIKSYKNIEKNLDTGEDYVIIGKEPETIPKLPLTENWIKNKNELINGIRESKYFIV